MKTTKLIATIASVFLMLISFNAEAQKFRGLDKSPLDVTYYRTSRNAAPDARVIYSRPQLKGRTVESLAPNGKVWRTGANESVEITFYNDTNFGGETIKAGTYSLFTIPGDKEWTIILNSDLHAWGSYSYNKDNDIARFKVSVNEGEDSIEAFSMAFSKDSLDLGWGTLRLSIPINK